MNFHTQKCKILSIAPKIFLDILPFQLYPYCIDDVLLEHVSSETDLGLIVSSKLNWSHHQNVVLCKAITQFNLMRRTCHFVKNSAKKRTLYLTIVRSLFEHASSIWCPSQECIRNKFEPFQKRCVKWILNEQFCSYSEFDYFTKLYELKLMPLYFKFMFNDLKLFYKIYKGLSPISMPDYIIIRTNTRSSSSDGITFGLSNYVCTSNKVVFCHSFFPRCISSWNTLPITTRTADTFDIFKCRLEDFIWSKVSLFSQNLEPEPD